MLFCIIGRQQFDEAFWDIPLLFDEKIFDITLIPNEQNVMFVVYDPERQINDEKGFCFLFKQKKSNCSVKVYR